MPAPRAALVAAWIAAACIATPVTPPPTATGVAPDAPSSTSATATALARPSTRASETEPFVRLLVRKWRPTEPTVFVHRRVGVGQGHVITAVPLSSGAPVDLVAFSSDAGDWDVLPVSGALVIATASHCTNGICATGPGRLAIMDLASGVARWLTPSDGSIPGSPIWSPDGAFIYYGAIDPAQADLGIFRIKPDGSDRTRVIEPAPAQPGAFGSRSSSSRPQMVTSNNTLFWLSEAGDRRALKARDLVARTDVTFPSDDPCVSFVAWYAAPPRALVRHGSCQTQTARLSEWSLGTGGRSVIVDMPDHVADADWEVTGRRIVAAIASPPDFRGRLVVFDGSTRSPLAGGDGAYEVEWTALGIATVAGVGGAGADCPFGLFEVRLVTLGGAPARALYRGCALGHLRGTR